MEREQKSFVEKAVWWAKVGGIVAAAIGVIRNMAELAGAGTLLAAGGFLAEGLIYKRSPKSGLTA